MSICFFTTADKKYEHFVLPYIFSILHHVPNSFVEIAVDDVQDFYRKYGGNIIKLMSIYSRFEIVPKDNFQGKSIIENTKRFLMTPQNEADIYYIGDIDIFIFDDCIEQIHKLQMMKHLLCYSNIVRPQSRRLTGLHACTEVWYKRTKLMREETENDFGSDELTLYNLASIFGAPESATSGNERPVHGLHLSPNRTIDSSPGWNVSSYGKKMVELTKTKIWKKVSPLFDKKYLELIDQVIGWYEKQ